MSSRRQTPAKYLMITACAGLFAFGSLLAFLGATLPELRARLGFDIEHSGTLFSLLFLPQIPMSFITGPLIDRFGKKPILASGSLLCAFVLIGITFAWSYPVLGTLVFALGLGASCLNSGSNTLVPDLYPENPSSALNFGNIFFSLGTVVFPLAVTLMATRLGLGSALILIAFLVAIPGTLTLLQRFPSARSMSVFNWRDTLRATLNPSIIILACVIFLYSSLEVSTGGWLRTYLEQQFLVSARSSGSVLTAFFALMMVGRLGASQITKKVRGPVLVLGCAAGAVAGLVSLVLAPNVGIAIAGAMVCGLCYAPIFPTTAGTASTYFPRVFGTVFGAIMAAGFTGSMVLPAAIGYIAKGATVRTGIWLIAASSLLLLLTQGIFVRHERRRLRVIPAS